VRVWLLPAALAVAMALAVALRIAEFSSLGEVVLATPFARPLTRPPLLDLLGWPLPAARNAIAWASGAITVLLTARLLRGVVPPAGVATGALLAAICPALVLGHGFWSMRTLTIPLVAGTAVLLIDSLRGTPRPRALAVVAAATLLADWTAWPPVLAWVGWLAVFRPAWLTAEQARDAMRPLVVGVAVALPAYALLIAVEGDPARLLGASGMPTGPEAARRLVGALAGLWLGLVREQPMALRIGLAAAVVGAWAAGSRRAAGEGRQAWASVLAVGTAGALVPALALHPWIPVAADKNLWALTPLTLALAVVALWPRRALVAAVLLVGCTDADGDGAWAEHGDCDDEVATTYPGAPELWDGVDNDCDGAVDVSADYREWRDAEPNDSSIGGCFAPAGQDLGPLAEPGLLSRIDGRITEVVDLSYDEGDFDCYAVRMPETDEPRRLRIELSWPSPDSDLDLALWGLWEGDQRGFVQGDSPGPGPEIHISSASLPGGTPLWLWVGGYSGEPTDYRVDLVVASLE